VHHVVAAALVENRRVLLTHRSPARTWYPDVWDLPGGHIEAGESAERAVTRELLEELGIVVDEPNIELIAGDVAAGSDLRLSVYRVHRWQGQPCNACPVEHDQIGWFEPGDLPKLDLAHPSYVDLLGALLT
jgi:8-oxo-dGTP diphosphatase